MEINNTIDTFRPSFFNASNNPYKDDKLYLNLPEDFLKSDLSSNSNFKFSLSYRGESFGQFIDVFCILTNQYIHMYSDKIYNNFIGSLDLLFMTTIFFKDEISNNRYGIKFIYNCITQELLTKDSNLFEKLKTKLRSKAIQCDFYDNFKLEKK